MKPIQKGYRINLSLIDEGYLLSEYNCSADNIRKAKSTLLKDCRNDDLKLKWIGDDLNYLNIPVVRDKNHDLFEYNGKTLKAWQLRDLKRIEKHQEELQKIISDEKITHCYIRKRGLYYSDNYNGYVEPRLHAGVYPKHDACAHAKGCDELSVIPIDNKEHNDYVNKHIEILKTRLL